MGHHHHHHNLLHLPSFGRKESVSSSMSGSGAPPPPPKGCMAIKVGQEGEEPQRFVVPVMYVNHPLFAGLLKEAEEEYGFDHKGAITIPCHVEYFRQVQGMIEKSRDAAHHHHHHHHQQQHHFHLGGCFGGGGLKA